MSVAFRYITKEMLAIFLVVFVLLLSVGLIGRFVGYLQDAATGRYSAEALWLLIGLRIPEFVQIIAPLSIFLALVLTYGRLHAEQEFTVLMSGGASPRRMVGWLLLVVVPMAAGVGYLSLEVTPAARKMFSDLALEQRVVSEFDAITPGTFRSFSYGTRVTYADAVDNESQRLFGVFMGEILAGRVMTMWAEQGSYYRESSTGSRFLLLEDGTRYEGFPGTSGYRVLTFEKLGQRIAREEIERFFVDASIIPTDRLDLATGEGASELHWRIALPLMSIIGALCGFGIARVPPRAGRFGRVLPALGIFVGYYILLLLLRNTIAKSEVLLGIGLWPVHVAMACVAAWLIKRSYRPA
mgnify:CR=1 FL=1